MNEDYLKYGVTLLEKICNGVTTISDKFYLCYGLEYYIDIITKFSRIALTDLSTLVLL